MDKKEKPSAGRKYMKYSGMAYQLAGLMFIAIFGGMKIDEWMGNEKRYITALLTIIFFSGYMAKLYYELNKKEK